MSETIAEIKHPASERKFAWETRLMLASPLSLWPSVAIISAGLFVSFLFCYVWNGHSLIVLQDGDPTLSYDAWTALCMSLLWGAVFGLGEYSRRANLADLLGLKAFGFVVDEAHLQGLAFGQLKASRLRARWFGFVGAGVGYVFFNLVYQPDGSPVHPFGGTLTNYWFIAMTLGLFIEIFRSLSYIRTDTRSLLDNLDHRLEIDFFDIGKLDGLGRIALRRALPWLVTSAIVFLMLFGQGSSNLFWVLIAALMTFATFVFAAPMWRMHVLIDKAKNTELKKLRRDIAAKRFEFESNESVEIAARLSALLALEHHLERVREWPLDVSTIVRFGVYLALPLGSWLGGALVERALNLVTG